MKCTKYNTRLMALKLPVFVIFRVDLRARCLIPGRNRILRSLKFYTFSRASFLVHRRYFRHLLLLTNTRSISERIINSLPSNMLINTDRYRFAIWFVKVDFTRLYAGWVLLSTHHATGQPAVIRVRK